MDVKSEVKFRLRWREVELAQRRKGAPGKLGIVGRLRRETTIALHWIAQRLNMGAAGSLANLLRKAKEK